MKKIASLILALLMLMSLFSVSVFAEDSLCETFSLNSNSTIEGEIFKLSAYAGYTTGWYAGGSSDWIKIEAKDSQNVIIDRVEARIHNGSTLFRGLSISSGDITKYPEFNSDYGVVSNINNSSFKFSGGNGSVLIDEIKVYYHYKNGCETFTYNTTEGVIFKLSSYGISASDGWYAGNYGCKIKIEAKDVQNVTIDRIEARVIYNDSFFEEIGISSGKKTTLPKESHDYAVISDINEPNFEFSGGSTLIKIDEIKVHYHYNPSSTASTISEGNVWIIAGIAIIAIGTVAIVAKKKKIIAE